MRALAIDDDPNDRRTFERLERYGLPCDAIPPPNPEDLAGRVVEPLDQGKYDVVLVDFRLDDQPTGTNRVTYRGGTVAAAIKEAHPEVPVVLVTTEERLRQYVQSTPKVRELFDHLLLKSQIAGQGRKLAAEELLDLCAGFRAIDSKVGAAGAIEDILPKLLGARAAESDVVSRNLPPTLPRTTADVARWLLQELLQYPGPLVDGDEARTRLGLSRSSFAAPAVQDWLRGAKYRGPFNSLRPRWWTSRLLGLLRSAGGASAASDPAKARVAAIARAGKTRGLTPDSCVWCGGGDIQRSCNLCHEAVDAPHQLVALIDSRPPTYDQAAICFQCIQTGADNDVRYPPGSATVLAGLRSGVISRPSNGS